MNLKQNLVFVSSFLLLSSPFSVKADIGEQAQLHYHGGLNLIGQTTPLLNSGLTASADFWTHYQAKNYSVKLHIEGSTAPEPNTVASELKYSNADSGTALNKYGDGRIQISELFGEYYMSQKNQLILGLMDASSWLDISQISNDENHHFIAAAFTGNLTIDFPDYAPAVGVILKPRTNVKGTFYISSAQGLADNQQKSYEALLDTPDDKDGAFIATEGRLGKESAFISIGVWAHTGPHKSLKDPTEDNLTNYGIYSVLSKQFNQSTLESRIGYTNPEISTITEFYSLTYQLKTYSIYPRSRYGLGVSHAITSPYLPAEKKPSNRTTLETYWAFPIHKHIEITPSLQLFKPPFTDNPTLQSESDVWVANLRIYSHF